MLNKAKAAVQAIPDIHIARLPGSFRKGSYTRKIAAIVIRMKTAVVPVVAFKARPV